MAVQNCPSAGGGASDHQTIQTGGVLKQKTSVTMVMEQNHRGGAIRVFEQVFS